MAHVVTQWPVPAAYVDPAKYQRHRQTESGKQGGKSRWFFHDWVAGFQGREMVCRLCGLPDGDPDFNNPNPASAVRYGNSNRIHHLPRKQNKIFHCTAIPSDFFTSRHPRSTCGFVANGQPKFANGQRQPEEFLPKFSRCPKAPAPKAHLLETNTRRPHSKPPLPAVKFANPTNSTTRNPNHPKS